MQARRARSDRVDLIEISDVDRVSRSHAGHRACTKKDLRRGLRVTALIGDVNELESVGNSSAFELGSLLDAVAVGDDSEAMAAQFGERRKDVGIQRPSRFVDAKIDVEELVRLRVGQMRANGVAHPRPPLILIAHLAGQESRKIGLHRRHPRRETPTPPRPDELLVERVTLADAAEWSIKVSSMSNRMSMCGIAFERSRWQFAQYAHTLAAVSLHLMRVSERRMHHPPCAAPLNRFSQ
jgi:hypothetical protein